MEKNTHSAVAVQPFSSCEEQLSAALSLLDEWLRTAYALSEHDTDRERMPAYMKGVVLTPDQVEKELSAPVCHGFGVADASERAALLKALADFEARIPQTLENRRNLFYWLWNELYDSLFPRFCLLLGLAWRSDRKYEKIFSFLQGNLTEGEPDLWLAMSLVRMVEDVPLRQCLLLGQDGFVWDFCFARHADRLDSPLSLREHLFFALLGQTVLPVALQDVARLEYPATETLAPPRARQALLDECTTLMREAEEQDVPLLLCLSGIAGAGRRFLARHITARLNAGMLFVDLDELQRCEAAETLCRTAAAFCAVNGLVPALCTEESEKEPPVRDKMLEALMGFSVYPAFQLSVLPGSAARNAFRCFQRPLPALTGAEAEALWDSALGDLPRKKLELRRLAWRYRMTPGQILAAVELARLGAADGITESVIDGVVRGSMTGQALQFCRRVEPAFTMEDIILPPAVKKQFQRILERVRTDELVSGKWGFGKKYSYGKGIGILLYGSPGTGKSMGAHVIARELGLDLLQVDISAIVSKYIGETEKNLSIVFGEAEKTNAILFFDEADSLFARRTNDMNNSNDKYANVETSHLLQKMEEYSGICILTTNMAMNFDKAFFRRFEFMINVPAPDEQTRKVLWEKAFPRECPLEQGIPFDILASVELSPSEIKTLARSAALLAAIEKRKTVGMVDIVEAVRIDCQRNGRAMPHILQ